MIAEEYAGLLAELLEAERAGAKLLGAYLREMPAGSREHTLLEAIRKDEAENCAVLTRLLYASGAQPTDKVGRFYEKGLAIQGLAQRLDYLNRGQAWVVRRLALALPTIRNPQALEALQAMHRSHVDNIEAATALLPK